MTCRKGLHPKTGPGRCRECWLVANRRSREKHREANRERDRIRREGEREQRREAARRRYWAKREELTAQRRAWYQENREKALAISAAWAAANPERVRAAKRRWAEKNPDYYRAKNQTRRARIAGTFVERVEFSEIYARARGRCALCGIGEREGDPWEIYHKHPLAHGGEHSYANTQLAHGSCNRRKAAKLPLTLF